MKKAKIPEVIIRETKTAHYTRADLVDMKKAPANRPTEYRPEYCARALEFLSRGHSLVALAGELKKAPSTIATWRRDFPEFAEAIEIGRAIGLKEWEDRLIVQAETDKGNSAAIIFALKNRGEGEWRERVEHTNTHELGESAIPLSEAARAIAFMMASDRVAKEAKEKALPGDNAKIIEHEDE